jgi:predicted metal-dependent HD superfamily phosphohydrolase
VLASFAVRTSIFAVPAIAREREPRARVNLRDAIARLAP